MALNNRHEIALYKIDDLLKERLLAIDIGIESVDEILTGVL